MPIAAPYHWPDLVPLPAGIERDWAQQAINLLQGDGRRSADTHLVKPALTSWTGPCRIFEAGGGNFAVAANAPPEHLAAVARDRGWRHLTLLSSLGTDFKKAFHAEDPDGQQEPMTLVFQRGAAGAIRLFWTSDLVWADSDPGQHHRASGTIEPFWNMFDLTPGGRPDFDEQLQYHCCAGGPPIPTDVDRGHA